MPKGESLNKNKKKGREITQTKTKMSSCETSMGVKKQGEFLGRRRKMGSSIVNPDRGVSSLVGDEEP
jgi:hypothetical protein